MANEIVDLPVFKQFFMLTRLRRQGLEVSVIPWWKDAPAPFGQGDAVAEASVPA